MKAAIIGAGAEALHTIKKAQDLGLYVVALDGNAQAEGLKAADKGLVVDISDEKAALNAVRDEKADFLLTAPIGRYLTTTGAVNDLLSLPGISRKTAQYCTDKWLFHQKLQGEKLRNCRCRPIEDGKIPEDGDKWIYPILLKPRFGSGSRGILLAEGEGELKEALKKTGKEPYVMEECIRGEEYGVDGIVLGGSFHLILLRKKENTPFPARQAVAYYSVLPGEAFYAAAASYMEKLTLCLGLEDCLLHADLIRPAEGQDMSGNKEEMPFVIEMSARPSGHNLHNLFTPLCTGVDEAEAYIRYRMGEEVCVTPKATKRMMIHYFDLQGRIGRVPAREEVKAYLEQKVSDRIRLLHWECNLKEGEILKAAADGHTLMPRGCYILQGESEEELRAGAEEIKRLLLEDP